MAYCDLINFFSYLDVHPAVLFDSECSTSSQLTSQLTEFSSDLRLSASEFPGKVCTLSVTQKKKDDARDEFQCYYCGDVSLVREDIIKCLTRHNENGWTAEDRIEIGGDTFEKRTIEVKNVCFSRERWLTMCHCLSQVHDNINNNSTDILFNDSFNIDTVDEIINNDPIDIDGNEDNLNRIAASYSRRTFSCDHCALQFDSAKDLRKHVMTLRNSLDKFDHNVATICIKHACRICTDDNGDQLLLETRQESMRHRREKHFYFVEEAVVANTFVRFVVMPDGKEITVENNYRYFKKGSFIEQFGCVCLIDYSLKRLADRCFARHFGENAYKCLQCEFDSHFCFSC
jgi:hypothetical protein